MAAEFVRPYRKRQSVKNDRADAEAILIALRSPGMRFVPVKTIEQLHIQARHRVRSELIKQRTAKANQIRGLLAEYGIVIGLGVRCLRHHLPEILEEAAWIGLAGDLGHRFGSRGGPSLCAAARPAVKLLRRRSLGHFSRNLRRHSGRSEAERRNPSESAGLYDGFRISLRLSGMTVPVLFMSK